jgi:hypothetical protein
MRPLLWLLVLLLAAWLLGACVAHERDVAIYDLWAKRGQVLGDLAHLYCEQGAKRERDMMDWAIRRSSYPAAVTIECVDHPRPP